MIKKKLFYMLAFIFIFAVSLSSAYFHERDMVNSCEKNGKSTYSSWYKDIKCEVIKND